jgi:hypothetical protein
LRAIDKGLVDTAGNETGAEINLRVTGDGHRRRNSSRELDTTVTVSTFAPTSDGRSASCGCC